jgi:hypothetical protein
MLLLVSPVLSATPIAVSFVASVATSGAPTNPVSGTIVYEAASPTADILSLLSIDLTISGHSYTLGEVGFLTGSTQRIGGILNGVDTINVGTTDFWLAWNKSNLDLPNFEYATPGTTDVYGSFIQNFQRFTVVAVPEPGTCGLLVMALGYFSAAYRTRLNRPRV